MKINIPYPQIHQLFLDIKSKTIKKGQEIFSPDSYSEKVYYLSSGIVQVYSFTYDKKMVKEFIISNELFGFEGLLSEPFHTNFAVALNNNCEVKAMHINDFKASLASNKALADEFLKLLGNRQCNLDKRLISNTLEDSEYLVIEFLEDLAGRGGVLVGVETLIPFMISHSDIGNLLGCSRQYVTATLSKLRKLNLIYYNRKKLIIRDFNGKIFKYLKDP